MIKSVFSKKSLARIYPARPSAATKELSHGFLLIDTDKIRFKKD